MKSIYEDLGITEKEFKDYSNTLIIDTKDLELLTPEVKTFDELYNWVQIDNPANGKYYYTLEVMSRVFLQNIVPYAGGNNPINDDNLQDVIKNHKDTLIKEYIESEKYRLTVEHFNW